MSKDFKKNNAVMPPTAGYFPVQVSASSLGTSVPFSIPTLARSLHSQIEKEVSKKEDLELLDYGPDPTQPAIVVGKRSGK